jgi:hypothetical protein
MSSATITPHVCQLEVEHMTRPNIESPIVVTRNAARHYVALAALLLAPLGAGAGIVHIQVQKKNGVEYGAGYTVGRDKECFVVTPLHVVDLAPADSITVTDAKGSSGKARLLKGSQEFDAGLLQIVGDVRLDCPADWSDGSAAVASVGAAPFLIARKVDDNGRLMQTRLFASSTSREAIELAPFGATDELRKGDSGSALYAGDQLVGMIVSVDTKTRAAHAITQSQLHGLFGADVLPGGRQATLIQAFTLRKAENAYATAAAREILTAQPRMQLVAAGADGKPPAGTQLVVSGEVVDVTSGRIANPDYKAPQRAATKDDSLGRQLFQKLERRVNAEVDDALERNTDSQYLRTFNVDVQIQIQKTADGTKVVNLERRSYKMPETAAVTPADMEKTAVTAAVREAVKATLEKYPL